MRIFTALFFLLLPQFVVAQANEGVRCVQSQLTAAGFDPGPEDGLLGRGTLSALAEYEKAFGKVSTRDFDQSLGDAICRRIGIDNPDMRRFWPSRTGLTQIIYGNSISETFKSEFELSVALSERAITNVLQLELSGKSTIIVAENATELKRLYAENTTYNVFGLPTDIDERCQSVRGISGSTEPGLTFFCKSADAVVGDGIEKTWLDFAVARSFLSLVQFQLSGAVDTTKNDNAGRLRFEGPVWLSAGSAQAFGNKIALGKPDWDFRIVNYRRLDNEFPALSNLETLQALQEDPLNVIRAGTVASIDLVDIAGYPAIVKFYEQLGFGLSWETAFAEAFDLSVDEFYEFYATVERFDVNGAPFLAPLQRSE